MAHTMDTKFAVVSITPKDVKSLKPSWTDEECIKKAEEVAGDVQDHLECEKIDFMQEEL